MSALDGAPLVNGDRQTVGFALLRCEVCSEAVPISIEVWAGPDDDGDECVFTDPNTFDLELHMLTHTLDGPWSACVECGNDDPCEGYDMCSDCLEKQDGET